MKCPRVPVFRFLLSCHICFGSQFAGTWQRLESGIFGEATCVIQEAGQRVSVRCDGKRGEGTLWHANETGGLEGDILRTTRVGPNNERLSVRRDLAPNGMLLRERSQNLDEPDKPILEEYYQRLPDPVMCTDVKQLDFRNLTIESAGQVFAFRAGSADTYELEWDESGPPEKPGFSAEINFDKVASPEARVTVRIVGFTDYHLTGSGWSNHVVGFTCVAGSLRRVFDREALSLQLESLTDHEITVSMLPYYGKYTVKRWRYKWSSIARRYQVDAVWLTH